MINLNEFLSLNEKPLIMGILNITPDSFSDGGRYYRTDKAIERALQMHEQGAGIIDAGGESTRPGSAPVDPEEEKSRVIPVIKKLKQIKKDMIISIDTRKAAVAEKALDAGADIINDVSGCTYDPDMIKLIRDRRPCFVLMHTSNTPDRMQMNPIDADKIISALDGFFAQRIDYFAQNGIDMTNMIIDPGIGFGKTAEANIAIISQLNYFLKYKKPILVGASRKSFIGRMNNSKETERTGGSITAALYSYYKGAEIIRCHDILETRQAFLLLNRLHKQGKGKCSLI